MQSEQLANRHGRAGVSRWMVAVSCIAATVLGAVLAIGLFTMKLSSAQTNFFVAARKKAELDIVSICQAVDNYTIMNCGRGPASLEVLVTPDQNGKTFLRDRTTIPPDPWNRPYGYEPLSGNRDYRVFSLGKDGQPGGVGDDADIDNFTSAAESNH
jgi:general secretion pathway protein G